VGAASGFVSQERDLKLGELKILTELLQTHPFSPPERLFTILEWKLGALGYNVLE
jgi:hypothetical protein